MLIYSCEIGGVLVLRCIVVERIHEAAVLLKRDFFRLSFEDGVRFCRLPRIELLSLREARQSQLRSPVSKQPLEEGISNDVDVLFLLILLL